MQQSLLPNDIAVNIIAKSLPSNFCIVPFKNLIFNPSGAVSVCRTKGTDHTIGYLKDNTVEEIWNNEKIRKWRQEFLQGNVSTCSEEIARENCNIMPENNFIWPELDLNVFQKNLPIKFTANFNGKCNLRCVMCKVWSMENGYYDHINFWEKAETDFFPFIKEIELLSGEPFIQKDTYRLIDIISKINPECMWSITTNSHWTFSEKIKSYLDKIFLQNIIISVDSLNSKRYSEIRKGGDLEIVLKNISDFNIYRKERISKGLQGFTITLHFLVMKNNWRELGDIYDLAAKNDMKLTINNLLTPSEFSLEEFSDEEKFRTIQYTIHENPSYKVKAFGCFFTSLINKMSAPSRAHALLLIKEKLSYIEKTNTYIS